MPGDGGGKPSNGAPHGAGQDDNARINLTDVGNGKRLVKEHGADLHYCFAWKEWLVWNGAHWHDDVTGESIRRAKRTIAGLAQWATKKIIAITEAIAGMADGNSG
jgi:hypothetical protein